ncbi:hypothetical protein CI238_12717 [Colletotrichum incanum]|uniref:Uncharacterized protein n=1 Tax=Colletotrichum incanum TaxID=1573173 RepID=A0A162MY23_COLIC|nr:hypothetical protein CI238_12717 [Colletotrichum incanum]
MDNCDAASRDGHDEVDSNLAERPPTSQVSNLASSSLASYVSNLLLGLGLGTLTKKCWRQSSPSKQAVLMAMGKAVESVSFDGDAELLAVLDDLVLRIEDLPRGNGIILWLEKIKESSFALPLSPG